MNSGKRTITRMFSYAAAARCAGTFIFFWYELPSCYQLFYLSPPPTLSPEYKAGSSSVSFVAGNKKKRGRAADTAFKYNFPRRDATGVDRRILPMVVVAVVQSTIRYSYVCGIHNLSQFRRAAPFCGKIRAFRDRLNNDSPDWNVSRRAKSSPGDIIGQKFIPRTCASSACPFFYRFFKWTG